MTRIRRKPIRVLSRVVRGCLIIGAASLASTAAFVDEGRKLDKLYFGKPLSDWVTRAADIDPDSAYAATIVQPLIEIIQDDDVADPIRGRLAVFLGRIGKPAAPVLAKILGDPAQPMANRVWAGRA
jgi:hypothetical protein